MYAHLVAIVYPNLASRAGSGILNVVPNIVYQASCLDCPLELLDITRGKAAVFRRNCALGNRAQGQ
jgi:hypothetical protein